MIVCEKIVKISKNKGKGYMLKVGLFRTSMCNFLKDRRHIINRGSRDILLCKPGYLPILWIIIISHTCKILLRVPVEKVVAIFPCLVDRLHHCFVHISYTLLHFHKVNCSCESVLISL